MRQPGLGSNRKSLLQGGPATAPTKPTIRRLSSGYLAHAAVLRTKGGSGESHGCRLVGKEVNQQGARVLIAYERGDAKYENGHVGVAIAQASDAENHLLCNIQLDWTGAGGEERLLELVQQAPQSKIILTLGLGTAASQWDMAAALTYSEKVYFTVNEVKFCTEKAESLLRSLDEADLARVQIIRWSETIRKGHKEYSHELLSGEQWLRRSTAL